MSRQQFTADGFVVVPRVLSGEQCDELSDKAAPAEGSSAGSRRLLRHDWCRALAHRLRGHRLLSAVIPQSFVAVQCTYFEKSASRNWLVPYHQDVSIPVAERVDHLSLSGWSEKEGSVFVRSPQDILEQLVAVRVHLDACAENDGPLRVIPGSHAHGLVAANSIDAIRDDAREVACLAKRGEALVLRPLLWHASSKSSGTSRRRVLHFLFGPATIPYGLRWEHAI